MSLEIQNQQNIGTRKLRGATVTLIGSPDTATAPELEREMKPILTLAVKDIVFNLAQLKSISSAGLRVFSMVRKQLKESGGQISYINMQPQIKEVFEIMKKR